MVVLASNVGRELRALMRAYPLVRVAMIAGAVCWLLAILLFLAMGIEALV